MIIIITINIPLQKRMEIGWAIKYAIFIILLLIIAVTGVVALESAKYSLSR